MSWTDERVELLRKMWGEGRTAAEIAGELGGITRNAVIGKAHRLKLSNRVSPIATTALQQDTAKKITLPVPANRDKPVMFAVPPRPAASVSAIKVNNQGVKMTELRDRMCRWPFGDPKMADFHFCGCPSVPGMPYCPDHARAAYQTARTRTLQAEDFEQQPAHVEDDKEAVG